MVPLCHKAIIMHRESPFKNIGFTKIMFSGIVINSLLPRGTLPCKCGLVVGGQQNLQMRFVK